MLIKTLPNKAERFNSFSYGTASVMHSEKSLRLNTLKCFEIASYYSLVTLLNRGSTTDFAADSFVLVEGEIR